MNDSSIIVGMKPIDALIGNYTNVRWDRINHSIDKYIQMCIRMHLEMFHCITADIIYHRCICGR